MASHEPKPDIQAQHAEDQPPQKPQTGNTVDYVLSQGYINVSIEDRAAALNMARQLDPGPPLGSYRNLAFVATMMVACMCSGDNGEWGNGVSADHQVSTARSCPRSTRWTRLKPTLPLTSTRAVREVLISSL